MIALSTLELLILAALPALLANPVALALTALALPLVFAASR